MTDETWSDEREIRIPAEPEEVWAAWAEPEHVRRWFCDRAHGRLEPGAELVHVFDGHGEHRYRVLEVDAPRRLVLDGEMDGRAFRQVVEIRSERGVTVLRLVHSGFGSADPDSEIVQGIDSGWTMALAVMRHYVERWFGRDKVAIAIFRPARFDYLALRDHRYQSAAGLGSWLTDGSSAIPDDGPVALTLRSGRRLTGRVLARTDHEVAVTWEEVDGVLELKAFGAGPEARVLGARALTWTDRPAVAEALRAELTEAVDRLVGLEMTSTRVTQLRGIWMGVADFDRSRAFWELLGARFHDANRADGIVQATLVGTKLVFESGKANPPGAGPFLLFDVDDADEMHRALEEAGHRVLTAPKDEPWGRQLDVLDPDGHSVALIGPTAG